MPQHTRVGACLFAWLLACDTPAATPGAHTVASRASDSPLVRCESACLRRLDPNDDAGWSACRQRCRHEPVRLAAGPAEKREPAQDESGARAEDEVRVRAAVEHAAFIASCAVDRVARRQRRAEREASAAAAILARRGEERRLYAYQTGYCRRELEQQIESEPCDSGSGVVRACERVVMEKIVYACPSSAPEAIRGRHPGATTYVDGTTHGLGVDPRRIAGLADEAPAAARTSDPSSDARDEVCQEADLEADDTDGGASAESSSSSDDAGRQRAGN